MADQFGSPTPRANVPATEPLIDPVTGLPVVDEPALRPENSYSTTPSDSSTTEVAKEQAGQVGHEAADAGRHVAGVAAEQASQTAGEAAAQAKNLYAQTRQELQGQAATQQQRLADGVRSLSSELESMAEKGNAGTASDLVREVSGRARDVAGWLDQRDPGAVLQEVTSFARRRPGTFLAIAAGAGLVAGRLTRGAISEARNESTSPETSSAPVAGSTGTPVAGYVPPTPTPVAPADPLVDERYEADGYPAARQGVL